MRRPRMTPGAGVPFPEFIEEGYAPGRKVWMIADGEELYGGSIPLDGSEDEGVGEFWSLLRRWDYGDWGAVFDGGSGTVLCGWHLDAEGQPVVCTYRYPDRAGTAGVAYSLSARNPLPRRTAPR